MIVRIKGFDLEIQLEEACVTVIEILDKQLFRSIIHSILDNMNAVVNNDIVLEENNTIINYSKDVEIIIDYFSLKVNSKSLIQSLHKMINTKISSDIELLYKIEEEVLNIYNLIRMTFDDFDFGISMQNDVNLLNLLKLFDVKIDVFEYQTFISKFYLYIDLISIFDSKKLLVFINLKDYFSEKEIIEVYKYLIYKKIKFICFESKSSDIIESEIKYMIDEDLVEFGPFR